MNREAFKEWAVLELLGHRRLGGLVQEVEMFGGKMCRIDIPSSKEPDKTYATQFFGAGSIYCLTPCSEETARQVARMSQPEPVQRWELPPARREEEADRYEREREQDRERDDNDEDAPL